MNEILRITDVMKVTGLAKSTLYMYVKKNRFPKPIRLGERAVGWPTSSIEAWIQSRIDESQKDRTYQSNNEV